MKEDWLKDIHDRLTDYEVDAPEGLWDDIKSSIKPVEEDYDETLQSARAPQFDAPQFAAPRAKRRAALWLRWSCAVAVAAAVTLVFLLRPTTTEIVPSTAIPVSSSPNLAAKDAKESTAAKAREATTAKSSATLANVLSAPILYNKKNESVERNSASSLSPTAPVYTVVPSSTTSPSIALPSEEKLTAQATEQDKTATSSSEKNGMTPTPNKELNADKAFKAQTQLTTSRDLAQQTRPAELERFSMRLFVAGGNSSLQSNYEPGALVADRYDEGNSGSEDGADFMVSILEHNQDKEVQTRTKHKLPVRFGLTAAYNLNSRLSVESGVTYTRLASELRSGTDDYYFTGEQRLHYVGLPLSLRVRLFTLQRFDVYSAATALTELRVAGSETRDYVLDNATWQHERQRIHSHPFQFSLALSVGANYRLTPAVALFAEPSLGYYFSDRSSVSTIYKEHPFNFQLNLGLRFNVK